MTPRSLDLRDLTDTPDRLLHLGYTRRDDETTDIVRAVVYERDISSNESQLRLVVQIHFELAISDYPDVSYADNCSYSFNGVYLEVLNRQMEPIDNRYYDEESEHPISVGTLELSIRSLGEVERLIALLRPGVNMR